MTHSARIPIPGTWNFRRAGETVDPALLAPGRLLRSDAIDTLGVRGRAWLEDLGVTTVIDLRSEDESAAHPDDIAGLAMDAVHLPVFSGSAADFASLDPATISIDVVYAFMADRSRATLAAALRAVATSPGATLVHCTAGKDRTGMVVALALTIAGASRDEVAADYAQSERHLDGEWADRFRIRARALGWVVDGPYEELTFRSPESAIRGVLDSLEDQYGSIDAYLDDIGFGAADRDTLRATLACPLPQPTARVD